jgi:hypothetical protein
VERFASVPRWRCRRPGTGTSGPRMAQLMWSGGVRVGGARVSRSRGSGRLARVLATAGWLSRW